MDAPLERPSAPVAPLVWHHPSALGLSIVPTLFGGLGVPLVLDCPAWIIAPVQLVT